MTRMCQVARGARIVTEISWVSLEIYFIISGVKFFVPNIRWCVYLSLVFLSRKRKASCRSMFNVKAEQPRKAEPPQPRTSEPSPPRTSNDTKIQQDDESGAPPPPVMSFATSENSPTFKTPVVFVNPMRIRELLSLSIISKTFSSFFTDKCGVFNNRYTFVNAARSLSDYVSEFNMIPELERGIRLIIEDFQNIATDKNSMETSADGKVRLCHSTRQKFNVIIDGMNVLFRWFSLIASSMETHFEIEARRFESALTNGSLCVDKSNDTQINELVFQLASMLAELSDRTNQTNKQTATHQYLDYLLYIERSLESTCPMGSMCSDRRLVRLASNVNVCCAVAAGTIKDHFNVLSKSVLPKETE